jgi:hypothetical protein
VLSAFICLVWMSAHTRSRSFEQPPSQGRKTTVGRDNESRTVTHSAIWALERLAHPRYGRDAPSLNWSVVQELLKAGLVSVPRQGRGGVSIPLAGQDFLRARAEL